ncbi:MAG: arylamine N-acetyltransferase [Archangium sp.]|nr:arylamine N-acetyltransferase [Archangium sp.]MDP3575343.1 arylamine N-acetyltransferase [Archangium sp.]
MRPSAEQLDSDGQSVHALRQLVREWLFTQPFHNLDLLASSLRGGRTLTREEALDRCTTGLGGPCHVQAAGFLQLVTSLGFEADLAAATITHPDDHLLVRVLASGRVWLCDVGNGQPYVEPFPADAPLRFAHLGWCFETRPLSGAVELRRASPDQPESRVVYRAALKPKVWADFSGTIDRHHHQEGFGPFLRGLRAVRMSTDEMIVLRDTTLTVYREKTWHRIELAEDNVGAILRDRLGLGCLPVDEAVEAWLRARRETS